MQTTQHGGESAGGALVSFVEALSEVRRFARALVPDGREEVALWEGSGRVLAEAIPVDRDQPPFDRATRDGFAVSLAQDANEAAGAVRGVAARAMRWRVLGEIFAGQSWTGAPLRAGEAVEIMTGAPAPPGADAVVMVEHVAEQEDASTGRPPTREVVLAAGRAITAEANIVRRGSEARAGERGLDAGTLLGPAEIALAASLGAATVQVTSRPRVAILSTGDELVELGDPGATVLEPHHIRNSNSYALAALVAEAGGKPWRLPIARDTRESILHAVEQARAEADLLLLTGGVSAGKKDLVEDVLLGLEAHFHFTGVRMQPGKPVVFGTMPRSAVSRSSPGETGSRPGTASIPVFGLPGNPVSTEVTFRCLVTPLLRALCGEVDAVPRFAGAMLVDEIRTDGTLTRFLPARLEPLDADGAPGPRVRPVPWKSSGDLGSNARANCYAVVAAGREICSKGEWLPVLLR